MKKLSEVAKVSNILSGNSVLIEIDGAVRRIPFEKLSEIIAKANADVWQQVAWCVEIKQAQQSSPDWGVTGNTAMRDAYEAECGRYLVTNKGLAAKLDRNNSALFADGSSVVEARGHVMYRAPRLYYNVKVDPLTQRTYLWMSALPVFNHFVEEVCMGAYKGSMSGNALVSRSGVAPTGSKTINQFFAAAQENSANWGITNVEHRKHMIMKMLSKYGHTNIQEKLGYGVCGSSSLDLWSAAASLKTGVTKSMGDNYGKQDISVVNGSVTGINCSRVNFGGIEDPYGWQWEMIQGCYFGNSANAAQDGTECFLYDGNRMPTTAELTTVPSGNYRKVVRPTTSGYISQLLIGEEFDIIPKTVGASGSGASSYWCDYFWGNNTGQLLLWGGTASSGPTCGLAYAHSHNAFSDSNSTVGARLAYYGKLEHVTGTELLSRTT